MTLYCQNVETHGYCLTAYLPNTPEIVEFFADLLLSGIVNPEGSITPHNASSDGGKKRKIKVQCFPLYSVLKAIDISEIDYFSLDIEGAEFQVLTTIPWDLLHISILGVETEHAGTVFSGKEEDIVDYMSKAGYRKTHKLGHDMFFVNKRRHSNNLKN